MILQGSLLKYNFLVEKSETAIYQRIISSYIKTLTQLGHTVTCLNISSFANYLDFFQYIQSAKIDYCIITNVYAWLASYSDTTKCFIFETLDIPTIFTHHDNNFSVREDPNDIALKLRAFHKLENKAYHFCLEYFMALDLQNLGIKNVYSIQSASEFEHIEPPESYAYNISFVGHILPEIGNTLNEIPWSHLLRADFWNRLVHLDAKLEHSAISFANDTSSYINSKFDWFAAKYFYISMLHLHSQFFRGELIKRIQNLDIDIFGGDPAYLHGLSLNRNIQKQGIKYHPPTSDYSLTKHIYANSKINLNITSLQFEDAVINRVIDIGAVGGFVLTDWKSDLKKITSVYEEISYRTIDELNYKIDYYLANEEERLQIAEKLHQDVIKNCSYDHIVNFILSKISLMSPIQAETLRLDLGCGVWKPEGFVGVDINHGLGVDVIADLNRRFPFADDSVDEVRAHDVIEHLPDRIHTMNEIWRICKPGAKVEIRVPSTDGRGAFQDPTHVSFWNVNSFQYYCIEFPPYIELCKSYGFQGAFSIVSLEQEESSDQVIHVKAILTAVKSLDNCLLDDIINELNLKEINLGIFPDWGQPQESLALALENVIRAIATHPDRSHITLVIDIGNISEDDASLLLSSVTMNLLIEENLDVTEGPEVSLISQLSESQWEALLPHLDAWIVLENENQQAIAMLTANNISSYELDKLSDKRAIQLETGTWNLQ